MKIKFTLSFMMMIAAFTIKAQTYVTIPDSNFVTYLQAHYPTCMSGNQMDITCAIIHSESYVNVSGLSISDLTGIEYFDGLTTLDCGYNHLTSLPLLPHSVQYLSCNTNLLTSLPSLPDSLVVLDCSYNHLTFLPTLPVAICSLFCNNNNLNSLPMFPNKQFYPTATYLGNPFLICNNNNISCFPTFPDSLAACDISGNPFTCLPNYCYGMDGATLAYPLCVNGDLVNNPNGCFGNNGIVGNAYKDNNSNCSYDAADAGHSNVHFKLYDSINNLIAQTYSYANGTYQFIDSLGSYRVELDTTGMPLSAQCVYPGIDSAVILTILNPSVYEVNFSLICKPGFDIGVQSVVASGRVFPGRQHRIDVLAGDISNWYNLNCAAGVSGQVQITITGPVTFDSIVSGARTPSVSDSVFTYTIADFGTVDLLHDFALLFNTNTTATTGDVICVDVRVTPTTGDNNMSNNNYEFCYNVVNSYDPNFKEVYPQDVEPGYEDWFTYTIHFQNTGTAPAEHIRLTDTLDSNLDLETFQIINYSHYNTVSLQGPALTFNFPAIMLPDSTSDLAGSKGFVQYRIKPKAGLILGTAIDNMASIYFDYNAPVVTNTTVNHYVDNVSINENKKGWVNIYPNPGNGKYIVRLPEVMNTSELSIQVYNLLGEQIWGEKTINKFIQIDLSHQPNGVYILRLAGSTQSFSQRIIKQ